MFQGWQIFFLCEINFGYFCVKQRGLVQNQGSFHPKSNNLTNAHFQLLSCHFYGVQTVDGDEEKGSEKGKVRDRETSKDSSSSQNKEGRKDRKERGRSDKRRKKGSSSSTATPSTDGRLTHLTQSFRIVRLSAPPYILYFSGGQKAALVASESTLSGGSILRKGTIQQSTSSTKQPSTVSVDNSKNEVIK